MRSAANWAAGKASWQASPPVPPCGPPSSWPSDLKTQAKTSWSYYRIPATVTFPLPCSPIELPLAPRCSASEKRFCKPFSIPIVKQL